MKRTLLTLARAASFSVHAVETDTTDIERIQITGSKVTTQTPDPATDRSLTEILDPSQPYTQGGYGGASFYTEPGTQSIHTRVFQSGVPGNDPGAGWYDFGPDLLTGQERVTIIRGPNSVRYGSGSLGGTVFVEPDLQTGVTVRGGDRHRYVTATLADTIQITHFDVNNGSVRTDNTETDRFQNTQLRVQHSTDNWIWNASYTDYDYDYDNCWTVDTWQVTNDCVQSGERGFISARSERATVGYTWTTSEYFSEDQLSWRSRAERLYADVNDQYQIASAWVTLGVSAETESYISERESEISGYVIAELGNWELGTRVDSDTMVYRVGWQSGQWRASAGTSYRNASIYELHGDAWVQANTGLAPEKGVGYEVGYGAVSMYHYEFSEGIDYNFTDAQFQNTGSYQTQGVRAADSFQINTTHVQWGAGYTNSDQPRVARWRGHATVTQPVAGWDLSGTVQVQHRRNTDVSGAQPDNVRSVSISAARDLTPDLRTTLTVRDVFDREFEFTPGYRAGGREILLTIQWRGK